MREGIGDLLDGFAIGRLGLSGSVHCVEFVPAEETSQARADSTRSDVWVGDQIYTSQTSSAPCGLRGTKAQVRRRTSNEWRD